jgi:hypothetical protein
MQGLSYPLLTMMNAAAHEGRPGGGSVPHSKHPSKFFGIIQPIQISKRKKKKFRD